MNTSRIATKALAVLLLGCAAVACTRGLRAGLPAPTREPKRVAAGQDSFSRPGGAELAGSRARALLGRLPLYFIENRGQEDPQVAYYLQGGDSAVYFTSTGVTFALTDARSDGATLDRASGRPTIKPVALTSESASQRWAVRLDFVGANAVTPRGEQPTPAVVSYFKGGQGQQQSGLKTYHSVVYPELWPGIDLVYTGNAGQLKYTFLVKPGADPQQIRLTYRGATAVTLTDGGQLAVSTPAGGFTDDRPYAYQDGSAGRDEVPAAYALLASAADGAQGYGFTVGAYDRSRPLVLDPSVLIYAGYIGGTAEDEGRAIAVDAAGNAYVAGNTKSGVASFPTKVGPDLAFNGLLDAFVAKVKADGTELIYLGYIGGAGNDLAEGIAVDKAGNAYVTGGTTSDQTTFPVAVGPDLVYGGAGDAFVAKVKADGTGLVYCGYIGGAGADFANRIAVDSGGNAYVVGDTESDETTFPVKAGPDLFFNGGGDGFVAKVKADGTGLAYAGYIGGAGFDEARGIAVDAAGNAYVTGNTDSDENTFPVKVGPDLHYNGGSFDAFVAKVKPDGTALVYAGYIGGAGDEIGSGIAVDSAGNAYVTGFTTSDESTFPVKVGPSLDFGGGSDAFVAKVKADGTALLYAGYIGGSKSDGAVGIAVDAAGSAYVTGATDSDETTFPVKVGPGLNLNAASTDAFVAKVRPDGSGLLYAGYIGGADFDVGIGIALDAAGNVYIAGSTRSDHNTFPVTVGPDLNFNGDEDAFVAKLSGRPDLVESSVTALPSAVKPGGTLTVSDIARNLALGTAPASTTRYYLSVDTNRTNGDVLLSGSRLVPILVPGASHTGGVTVTLPAATPTGFYHVLACADDLKAITENDDENNCAPSGTVQVALPDLVESLLTVPGNPPSAVKPGDKFVASDAAFNVGLVSAAASTTRYYLSADGTKGAGDTLIGSRLVPALAPNGQTGSVSIGSATVTVPSTVVPGTYHLLACGDDTNAVKEAIETNNCTSSTGTVLVTFPDLVETSASAPPASIQRGHTFSLTDTVRNQGAVSAGTSTSRYYLSLDTVKGSGDTLLAGSRSVGILAGFASSSGTVSVTVPAGTVPNVYRVLACADDTLVVKEVNETNNCVDAGPLTVTP